MRCTVLPVLLFVRLTVIITFLFHVFVFLYVMEVYFHLDISVVVSSVVILPYNTCLCLSRGSYCDASYVWQQLS